MITRVMILLLVSVWILGATGFSQDSLDRFRYQEDKVPVNVAYHYVKSNLDGSEEEYVSIFAVTKTRLEVFKYRPGPYKAGYIAVVMDWDSFSIDRMESRLLDPLRNLG